MSPLFHFKSEEEKRKERIEQLVKAVAEIRFDPGIKYHPWWIDWCNSIHQKSPDWSVSDDLEQLLTEITVYLVDQIRKMPDPEQRLQQLYRTRFGPRWVQTIREKFSISIGPFIAQKLSEIHQKRTGVSWNRELTDLDEDWR